VPAIWLLKFISDTASALTMSRAVKWQQKHLPPHLGWSCWLDDTSCDFQVLLPYVKAKLDGWYSRHATRGVLGLALTATQQRRQHQQVSRINWWAAPLFYVLSALPA
jgi:hypothetical protein